MLPTEKIKSRNIDTVNIIARYTTLNMKRENEYQGSCPLCDDTKEHFYYNANKY